MAARVAINGFGRIGRNMLRAGLEQKDYEIVAVNDLTDAATLAHLLEYDSIHGRFPGQVEASDASISVNGKSIKVLSERDPAQLPWGDLGVDVVIESTGLFASREKAAAHLQAGARKVVISAPAGDVDLTLCYGVNHESYDPASHHVISNASCTTNCLSPVAKILHQEFTLKRGLMTTIHSYTNDQRILDLPHGDMRRARAAALSMIPTTTGAAKAVGLVLPELAGKLDGMAIRVPTPNVSVVDLVFETEKTPSAEEINAAMKAAADGPMKGVLQYNDKPLVSIDFNGNPHSSIFDAPITKVPEPGFAKILSWYDNEMGFSHRLCDVTSMIAGSL
ncbi:MAG TPA: type I glyceraldehyde-3-phosphate dehydrogenase [Deltaproteobacteria bacterium]|nr:type I glyceraldehyde-3-phosphate dehydrogenase [Candidatus Binatota bacterium]HIL12986.1 type I glyceraldehyde-3-phosphate dehydrogenase [Deltaproteobacteria bacterium]